MTFGEYIKAPGLSHSMLKAMHPTPFHLQIYLKEKREPTADQLIGTLAHSLILEPDKPLPKLAVQPAKYDPFGHGNDYELKDWNNNAKVCRAWVAEQRANDLIVITAKEYETINGVAASVASFGPSRELLEEGDSEVSLFREINGIMRKARLDFVTPGNTMADIKTTRDASYESFRWEILDRRYHSQGAWYMDVWNNDKKREQKECYVIVAVEKKPPYLVACYQLDREMLDAGRQLNMRDEITYRSCSKSGEWPAYPEEYVTMSMPEKYRRI